jgi:hypothetical protein
MWTLSRWLALGLVAVSPAYADGISGTYVGKGTNIAVLLLVVETAGHQLTGRYEQTVLGADGKVTQIGESITGASDGQTIVVTFKPTDILSASVTASGTIQGAALHLSGVGPSGSFELSLSKSDEAAYKAEVATLSNEGHRLIEASNTQSRDAFRRSRTSIGYLWTRAGWEPSCGLS